MNITDKDIDNLKERMHEDDDFWWYEDRIDEWAEELKKDNKQKYFVQVEKQGYNHLTGSYTKIVQGIQHFTEEEINKIPHKILKIEKL